MNHIDELVSYLKLLSATDPIECEKIMELLADYHIESNPEEEVFWNDFLKIWKKDMN